MQQAAAPQSADVIARPVQAATAPQPTHAPDVAPALPAIPAIPAIPAVPAVPALAPIGPAAAFPPEPSQISFTTAQAPDVWSTGSAFRELVFSDGFQIAAFLLVFPFALALARRVWVRGGPRPTVVDIENSPRLQRIEQAIESIALEVERIGEAQRFTTKVLAEREPVAGRIAAPPAARREPGVITPH
jgi:hypothetical protein